MRQRVTCIVLQCKLRLGYVSCDRRSGGGEQLPAQAKLGNGCAYKEGIIGGMCGGNGGRLLWPLGFLQNLHL